MTSAPHREHPFGGGIKAWAVRALVGDRDRPAADPHLPDGRADRRYLTAAGIAGLVCLVVATDVLGPGILLTAVVAAGVGVAVEVLFGVVRHRRAGGGAVVFGLLLALATPHETPLWMVALAAGFGTALGKEAFGGTGYHVFQPVLIAKAFLLISYPTAVSGWSFGDMLGLDSDAATVSTILLLVAGGGMIVARPANVWILGGIGIAGGGMAWWFGATGLLPAPGPNAIALLAGDGFLLGAVFFATDPAGAPNFRAGQIVYGLLVGLLAIVMSRFGNYGEGMLWAVLVGNLCAPLIDAIGISSPATRSTEGGMP